MRLAKSRLVLPEARTFAVVESGIGNDGILLCRCIPPKKSQSRRQSVPSDLFLILPAGAEVISKDDCPGDKRLSTNSQHWFSVSNSHNFRIYYIDCNSSNNFCSHITGLDSGIAALVEG
jgi:hypothetical protein